MARGDELAFLARKGGIVDDEGHLQGGFIHLDQGQGLGVVRAGDRFTDIHLIKARYGHQIAGPGLVDFDAREPLEAEQLADAAPFDTAVIPNQGDGLAVADRAVVDLADHDPAQEIGIIEGGHLHLQGLLRIADGGRHMAQDRVKERLHVVALDRHGRLGIAGHAATKQIGEVALVVVGAQFQEQVEHLVDGLFGVDAGPVNLVDEHDRPQTLFQGLLEHETGLGHGPFVGIHDQQAAIHHAEHPLHLTTEIGVARGINNIDTDAVVINCRILREDRDAALTLQVVGIHHAGGHGLTIAEDAGLAQQGIDQGGFAVVNVGNDRNVANRGALVFAAHGGSLGKA